MSLRDAMPGATRHAAKLVGVTWCEFADVLLLQRPPRLDGIEVWRVRRQVDDTNAASGAGWGHAWVVMSPEVVHHDDVAAAELGQQLGLEPPHEPVLVRRLEHRRKNHPAGQPDGAEQREVLAPIHRDAVNKLLAALHPGMAAAHGDVHPRLVEEHQPLERNSSDLAQERFALGDDIGAQTLQRPSALFFTT